MKGNTALKKVINGAIDSLLAAVNMIDERKVSETKMRKSKTKKEPAYVWDGSARDRASGYKISGRKGTHGRRGQRWGDPRDPKACEVLLGDAVKYIVTNRIKSRGELCRMNNPLYMALWHRNLLPLISERVNMQ